MKKNVKLILALLLLEVYTVTSKSLRNSEEAAADVRDDQGLKDLARQLVKSKDSGHIDCDNILVWDALLQEEGNQEKTITTCGLCSHDEFLKMHMPLFERHCGYGKGGFPSICFNPAGWENLLYSFKEEQLVKACALCDNGMFKRVHPDIFEENCEHDGEDEEEETRGAAEEEGGEDEEEDTRGAAEEVEPDHEEDTRGDKLDFIDKGKTDDDDLVLAVEQFVRDTAKNMEALADRLDRYEKQQKIQEWKP
ncbi:uncharacterized protein LOC118426674 [Branchiostoma floridae]|uniref:Uncharacterized protein LOC118426674 n=1 Tax=Branchiostoma floridae TaxID=7739 RepID=A0A9J7N3U6_BRAFL|nr:uncharacterized protein LOC118426674 [Branchiostoma floridae]